MNRSFLARVAIGLLWTTQLGGLPPVAASTAYWSQAGGIWRSPLAADSREFLVPGFEIRGVAVSDAAITWTDVEPRVPIAPTGVVHAATRHGSDPQNVARDLPLPSGVVLDTTTRTVFWSDLEQNAIYRRSIDGKGAIDQVLGGMASVSAIHSLALDPSDQKLYFGFVNPLIDNLFPASIAKINLDGTGFEPIVDGLTEPWCVAVDGAGGRVYWTDGPSGSGMIGRAALDGTDVVDLITGLAEPRGIALDVTPTMGAPSIVWADSNEGAIYRADFDGANVQLVLANLNQPRAVAILPIPEPATLALTLIGAIGLVTWKGSLIQRGLNLRGAAELGA
jgi:hypothetical protein